MSKTFFKSTKMAQATLPSSKFLLMFSLRLIKERAVKYFCLKPNCKSQKKLFLTFPVFCQDLIKVRLNES